MVVCRFAVLRRHADRYNNNNILSLFFGDTIQTLLTDKQRKKKINKEIQISTIIIAMTAVYICPCSYHYCACYTCAVKLLWDIVHEADKRNVYIYNILLSPRHIITTIENILLQFGYYYNMWDEPTHHPPHTSANIVKTRARRCCGWQTSGDVVKSSEIARARA